MSLVPSSPEIQRHWLRLTVRICSQVLLKELVLSSLGTPISLPTTCITVLPPHQIKVTEMSFLQTRANDALRANMGVSATESDITITTHGSDVYWAVCAVMVVSTFAFIGLSFSVDRSKRIFHYITAAITMVAAIAYFTMASNLGYASIVAEFQRSNPVVRGVTREIFYVRYIDWFVTTPVSSSYHLSRLPTHDFSAPSPRHSTYGWSPMAYDPLHHPH